MVKNSVNLNSTIITNGTFNAHFTTNQNTFTGSMGIVNATSNNYNDLANKPSINGVTLVGDKTSEELKIDGDKHYVYNQVVALNEWNIQHNLNKYPSVTIVDSAENVVVGDVVYIDKNNVRILFVGSFSGKVYLN